MVTTQEIVEVKTSQELKESERKFKIIGATVLIQVTSENKISLSIYDGVLLELTKDYDVNKFITTKINSIYATFENIPEYGSLRTKESCIYVNAGLRNLKIDNIESLIFTPSKD